MEKTVVAKVISELNFFSRLNIFSGNWPMVSYLQARGQFHKKSKSSVVILSMKKAIC